REITPITKNTPRKPIETPALTFSARPRRALVPRFGAARVPKKNHQYVGYQTKPHGLTAANTPSTNE
ncbi:MAG: hypothetical protein ACKOEH_03090, partial [Actinomycetota bacterium]